MTVTQKRNARFRARRRPKGARKALMRSLDAPRSPRSILDQARRSSLLKRRDQGDVVDVPRTKAARAPPAKRFRKLNLLPLSTEHLEKNCFEREVLPEDYVFVPKGDVYVTRNCRSRTKESGRLVYVVYDKNGKRSLGLRVPKDIHAAVHESAAESAESRAKAVKLRDEKDFARARQLLATRFPLMPAESLQTILHHAFLKGTGRVGRSSTLSDERKADLAVEAHIRHTKTEYEALLKAGKGRERARNETRGQVLAIKTTWAGATLPARQMNVSARCSPNADSDA
ncbi:hypothetical protein BO70DRAFT_358942 [Aspergillus heteromorphus CBS 117.55]|uniref:DUF2293 domain-containing protein n=1 Tax=Aspergillus heteromorphus CBS 117.55 TaxID=1448321 RepID=A0A317X0C2_9EURO|nr:uncharacterized protein BO70DRAFT_358942 [Aspergillus heteromorphus CBS 117.55]PWY89940.1 hypothetical protein BO70DRAFT_358942 [Aspergillus heteromorphus CBS 117.55]